LFPPAIAFLTLLRGKTRKAIHSSSKDLENVQKRLLVCLCWKKYFHSRTMRTKKVIWKKDKKRKKKISLYSLDNKKEKEWREVPSKEVEGTRNAREGSRGYKNGRRMIKNKRWKEEEAMHVMMMVMQKKCWGCIGEKRGRIWMDIIMRYVHVLLHTWIPTFVDFRHIYLVVFLGLNMLHIIMFYHYLCSILGWIQRLLCFLLVNYGYILTYILFFQ